MLPPLRLALGLTLPLLFIPFHPFHPAGIWTMIIGHTCSVPLTASFFIDHLALCAFFYRLDFQVICQLVTRIKRAASRLARPIFY